MNLPEIATTVVGSYPVPEWLRAHPSEPALRDAVLVVMKTQELAGKPDRFAYVVTLAEHLED